MPKKPIILTFFEHFPKFAPLPLQNFGMNLKFDHTPMCILLKLDYAKFSVSNLFFSKVIEEKPLEGGGGGSVLPPPDKGRVKDLFYYGVICKS